MLFGCAAGQGDGTIEGSFTSSVCDATDRALDIEATFFSMEQTEELSEIRIQDGSDFEDRSDGVILMIRDTQELKTARLGEPIDLSNEDLVEVNLYMNESCGPAFSRRPVNFRAYEGVVVFDRVYARDVDADDTEIAGTLMDVRLRADGAPGVEEAALSGWFRFFFNRGRPAQRFP